MTLPFSIIRFICNQVLWGSHVLYKIYSPAEGGANVIGAAGVGGDVGKVATKVVSTGAGVATNVCKENNV